MIVAMSREFGAGALEIARVVGERCGLDVLSAQATLATGNKRGVPAETPGDEDVAPSLLQRLITQLPSATLDLGAIADFEEIDVQNRRRLELQAALMNIAGHGNAVILGRGASFALGVRWDVVRVFVHAPLPWRIARLVTRFGYTDASAVAAIKRIDGARARYIREFYTADWADAHGYDLTIDTSRMPTSDAAEVIISAVALRYNAA